GLPFPSSGLLIYAKRSSDHGIEIPVITRDQRWIIRPTTMQRVRTSVSLAGRASSSPKQIYSLSGLGEIGLAWPARRKLASGNWRHPGIVDLIFVEDPRERDAGASSP